MRVKIFGPITAERLAEALAAASNKFTDAEGFPLLSFYGANLYLTAYDQDGQAVDLQDNNGKDVSITLPAIPGEPARPALSDAVKAQRASREEESKRLEEMERMQAEARRKEREIEFFARQKIIDANTAAVQTYDDVTRSMIEADPVGTVNLFNSVIDAVWQEMKPVYPYGKEKGKPRLKPKFEIIGAKNQLFLHRDDTGVHYIKVKNPVCKLSNNSVTAFWENEAWKKVSTLLFEELNKHARTKSDNKKIKFDDLINQEAKNPWRLMRK